MQAQSVFNDPVMTVQCLAIMLTLSYHIKTKLILYRIVFAECEQASLYGVFGVNV